MVQHAVSAETPYRGSAPGSGSRIEAQQIVERGVGRWRCAGPGRKRSRVVFAHRGSAAAPNPPVAGFFVMVACVFQRRFSDRSGGEGKVLEGSESAGAARKAGGCTCGPARMES